MPLSKGISANKCGWDDTVRMSELFISTPSHPHEIIDVGMGQSSVGAK